MKARKNVPINITSGIWFFVYAAIFVISLIVIAYILNIIYGSAISGTMLTLTLGIFAAMAYVEANRKYEQSEKERRINHIEKCMVNFYLPLRTMFDHEWNNYTILDHYTANKEKYESIGNYVYLTEKNMRELYKIHPTTNDDLKNLFEQVEKDIKTYQDEFDALI